MRESYIMRVREREQEREREGEREGEGGREGGRGGEWEIERVCVCHIPYWADVSLRQDGADGGEAPDWKQCQAALGAQCIIMVVPWKK